MTIGEGEPHARPDPPGPSATAEHLRRAVWSANAESARATRVAHEAGFGLSRDSIELIELRRRVLSIADTLDRGDSTHIIEHPASAAGASSHRHGSLHGTAEPGHGPTFRSVPRLDTAAVRTADPVPIPASTTPLGGHHTGGRTERKGTGRGVALAEGGNVSLYEQAPNLTAVAVGLGWDVRATAGTDFDLDASALATGPDRKVLSDRHFVFYNNLRSPEGSIEHTGDNRTGEGEGDDEVINVDLAATPPTITNILFPVSIHDAHARQQSFGQVRNAFIRIVDRATGAELARYDLTEDACCETAMVFGELYRHGDEWRFRASGRGYASGLAGIARDHGVDI